MICKRKRNFGWGKSPRYAVKCALKAYYSGGHYGTTHSHISRFQLIFTWIEANYSVSDLRHLTLTQAERFFSETCSELSPRYRKNLVSTWNVVTRAVRGDDVLYITPMKYSGRISGIREVEPIRDKELVWAVIEDSLGGEEPRVAAIIGLARFFGMRSQEALLADVDRIMGEARAIGKAAILEGCKGGRRSRERAIAIGEEQKRVLDLIARVRPRNSFNLLDANEVKHLAGNHLLEMANAMLERNGLGTLRELRACFLCDAYERVTGKKIPMIESNTDDTLDEIGRREVARLAGHCRLSVSNAYVGK
ncbi:MAG: integrase domain-containing protein [Saccharospirillum sp.]|nr:integrase domain-containing protein [Saccharospirillum sp.]